jgi:hypothetical protein
MEKMDTKLNGACTIVSPNYLPFARTLAKSYLHHHPKDKFYVLVVARSGDKNLFNAEPFSAVMLEEIGIPKLAAIGMKYDILELNTNVKPSFMKYIFDNSDLDNLVYLDPDIYIYNRLDPVFNLLEHANVVLTPHITSPINDDKIPTEQEFLSSGTYNLGFIAVRRSSESNRMLDWWESRCLEQGYNETRTGLFVDQKWMNLAPCLFEKVEQCKDQGCNMAYWNLHERSLTSEDSEYVVNGIHKLRFFHFSGVDINRAEALSKYTDRFDLLRRKDLVALFATYKQKVVENRNDALDAIAYGFDFFEDGIAVTQLARRIYAACEKQFLNENPFSTSSGFYRFAKDERLIGERTLGYKPSWNQYDPADTRVVWIHRLLKITLFLLRSNRYELLMKYLAHISVLRQQIIFWPDQRR